MSGKYVSSKNRQIGLLPAKDAANDIGMDTLRDALKRRMAKAELREKLKAESELDQGDK